MKTTQYYGYVTFAGFQKGLAPYLYAEIHVDPTLFEIDMEAMGLNVNYGNIVDIIRAAIPEPHRDEIKALVALDLPQIKISTPYVDEFIGFARQFVNNLKTTSLPHSFGRLDYMIVDGTSIDRLY